MYWNLFQADAMIARTRLIETWDVLKLLWVQEKRLVPYRLIETWDVLKFAVAREERIKRRRLIETWDVLKLQCLSVL